MSQQEDPATPEAEESSAGSAPIPSARARAQSEDVRRTVFCNQCGWENPAGSRFCAQCGAALQVAVGTPSAAPGPPAHSPKAAKPADGGKGPEGAVNSDSDAPAVVGRRVGSIFGIALLAVVAIFMILFVRDGSSPSDAVDGSPASSSGFSAPTSDVPLTGDLAARVEDLSAEAEDLSGEARLAKLRELVDVLAAAGRFDRAATEMEAIATVTGAEADWTRAGNFYYDWMDPRSGQERVTYAKAAIAAYRKVLELNPDNLDVRTDLAIAYMSDPDNPMLAIQENTAVLSRDSLHVQANFNRGIMLLNIGRVEQALAQFEKVQRIVGNPEDPMYRLAEQAMISVRSGLSSSGMTTN